MKLWMWQSTYGQYSVQIVHIWPEGEETPLDSPFNLILSENVMFFHQIIDAKMKSKYCLIIIDPQIDEKTSHFHQKWGWKVNLAEYIWTWFCPYCPYLTSGRRDTTGFTIPPHFWWKCDVFSSIWRSIMRQYLNFMLASIIVLW